MLSARRLHFYNLAKSVICLLLLASFIGCAPEKEPDDPQPNPPNLGEHLTMGNPSDAKADVNNCANYLLTKKQYVLSYNCSTNTANWASWRISMSWKGTVQRQDDFRSDTTLPAGLYRVKGTDYQGSGFDRGHLCPSDDRDKTVADNSATFLMTNMIPQAPNNNRGLWADLEAYCRKLAANGNELYVIAGPQGKGGSGSNGGNTNYIIPTGGAKITVPAYTWKVILVLPEGENDILRVTDTNRVIAVKIPNTQDVGNEWGAYRVSARSLEQLTGFNFFSLLSTFVQDKIENRVDTGPTH